MSLSPRLFLSWFNRGNGCRFSSFLHVPSFAEKPIVSRLSIGEIDTEEHSFTFHTGALISRLRAVPNK